MQVLLYHLLQFCFSLTHKLTNLSAVDDNGSALEGNARARLQQPIQDGRIFFAGEATSLLRSATVPGAVLEGQRVGNASE